MGWLPENASTYGGDIDNIFWLIFAVTGVVFLLTEILLVVFVLRYRSGRAGRATYTHGNNTLELIWTLVPAVMLVFLALMSDAVWSDIRGTMPDTPVVVDVMGEQFNWQIRYAGPDGQFGRTDPQYYAPDNPMGLDPDDPAAADDMVRENDMHVPVGTKVQVRLWAKDVIHSFFVPELRLKQDTVPGLKGAVWFEATKTGRFEIACAELCGFGHYTMRAFLTIHPQDEYQQWLQEATGTASAD